MRQEEELGAGGADRLANGIAFVADVLPGNHANGKLARQMETSDAAKPIYRRAYHWGAARA